MKFMRTTRFLQGQFRAVMCFMTVVAVSSVLAGQLVLEDNQMLVAFDTDSGGLTRLENKSTHWIIERRPELGVSFRLHAPLPGRRDNFVLGQKQHPVEVKKISDHQIHVQWRNLTSEHGGNLPISLSVAAGLTNGVLTFDCVVVNDSALVVETVDYPCFGDFSPPTRTTPMSVKHVWYGNLPSAEIYPNFGNEKGYWGVDFPTKTIESKQSLFCLIQSPREGLYVEMADPTQPYLLQFTFEQHPGVLQSLNNPVPAQDEISGLPVHLEFRATHFIFAHPHSSAKLAPVALRCYDGDWHAGVDLYKQWRATWFKPPRLPNWIKEVNCWTMLRLNTPEEDYAIPYTNLVNYGAEYASNGVSAYSAVAPANNRGLADVQIIQ